MNAHLRTVGALVAAALLWLGARASGARALETRDEWPKHDETLLVLPPDAGRVMWAGYNELGADITWVRTLIYYGSAKIGKSDFRYLERLIDSIIALDPKFKDLYYWAAAAVTYRQSRATQEEFETSVKYLRMGLAEFPDDYELHEALVMKLWWDLAPTDPEEVRKNRTEAARVAERAMRLPSAPPAAATRIAAMWGMLGEVEHARATLRQMLLTTENKEARAKMIERFRAIAGDLGEVEMLAAAKEQFDSDHAANLPFGPSDLFVILGKRPERKTVDELTSGTLMSRIRGALDDDETKTEPSP